MRVSILQTDVKWSDSQGNFDRAIAMVEKSCGDSDLIIMPEMAFTGFNINSKEVAVAADGGPLVAQLREYSKSSGKSFIFSSAVEDNGKYYNRLFAIMADGTQAQYDKRHLFRMAGEDKHYSAGAERIVIEYKGVRIMPLICYDLRFPVYSRFQDDYDMIIYVAQWPDVRSYQWSTLLKARAIENRAYVVGCNRCGDDPKLHYSGDSVLLDFLGKPIVAATPYKEEVITADVDIDALRKFRESFPADMDADNFTIEL